MGLRFKIKHKCNFCYNEVCKYGLTTEKRSPRLIVSLTTFPARIKYVHYTINTLLNQTLKADKVILWLAEEQFTNKEKDLPKDLLRLKDFGLTISWCEDLKSYKKLIPTIQTYLNDKNNIYARRCLQLKFINNELSGVSGAKCGYKSNSNANYFNQQIGMYACLYPPHSLYKDITNINKIKTTIPTHDDVYFWSMAILNRTKIQVVDGFDASAYLVEGTQNSALKNINQKNNAGIALKDAYKVMIKEYPEILTILKEE